jgi:UDP-glucose 4-epimerase
MSVFLVTGAAGFIGSALVHELIRRGEHVRALDNLDTGKLQNIADVLDRLEFLKTDIMDSACLATACRGVDYILHEAALPSVSFSVEDPLTAHHVNLTGTLNVLQAARNAGVKRVIYAASSAAYGENELQPKLESMTSDPVSPYAVQKLAGEYYMRSFTRLYGLETVCLRYFNIFGPRQSASSAYSGVIARFITQMLEGETPTVFGDGEGSRDFTYVEDVVRANLLALAAPSEPVAGRCFNIGTGRPHSINSMISILKNLLAYKGEILHLPPRAGDIKHSCADISKARRYLNYEPQVTFEAGLKNTVEWYKSQTGLPLSRLAKSADHK